MPEKRMDLRFLILLFCLGILMFPSICAQGQELRPILQEEKSEAGIPFLRGGVGIEEREMMKSMESAYNVKLVFSMIKGDYLADIAVDIKHASGKSLAKVTSNGPWFYAKLPTGKVTIRATMEGRSLIKNVDSGRGFKVVRLHWQD